jgi:predicted O-linked N-acetylglucosamine transferase (SPINDLY family)
MDHNKVYHQATLLRENAASRCAIGFVQEARLRLADALIEMRDDELWKLIALDLDSDFAQMRARTAWDSALRARLYAPLSDAESALAERLASDDRRLPPGGALAGMALFAPPLVGHVAKMLGAEKQALDLYAAQVRFLHALSAVKPDRLAEGRRAMIAAKSRLVDGFIAAEGGGAMSLRALIEATLPLRDVVLAGEHADFVRSNAVDDNETALLERAVSGLNAGELGGPDGATVVAGMITHTPEFLDGAERWIWNMAQWRGLLLDVARVPVKIFRDTQHSLRYEAFVEKTFHDIINLTELVSAAEWDRAAEQLLRGLKMSMLYSNPSSLVGAQRERGRLADKWANRRNAEYDVAPAPLHLDGLGRKRIGFLLAHTSESSEKFVALAHLKGLDPKLYTAEAYLAPHSAGQSARGEALERIAACSDAVFDLSSLPLPDRAAFIRHRGLAALIVVNSIASGISGYIELAGHRLAPLQIVLHTAKTTTGLRNIDVWLSGEACEASPRPQDFYTERLVMKRGTVICFDGMDVPELEPLPARENRPPTLISGASFCKLNEDTWDAWLTILASVPRSELRLYPFNPNPDTAYPRLAFEEQLERRCAEAHVDRKRIVLVGPWENRRGMYQELAAADLYLDSFPHSGGLSSLDALMVGTPVVTLKGPYQRSSQAASILESVGLEDWVTKNIEEYVARAVAVASAAPEERARISPSDLQKSSVLDVAAFGEEFSACLDQTLNEHEPADQPVVSDVAWRWKSDLTGKIHEHPKRLPALLPKYRVDALGLSGQLDGSEYRHVMVWASGIAGEEGSWEHISFKVQNGPGFLGIELREGEARPPLFGPGLSNGTDDYGHYVRLFVKDAALDGPSEILWSQLPRNVRLVLTDLMRKTSDSHAGTTLLVEPGVTPDIWRDAFQVISAALFKATAALEICSAAA